jgi:multiple sugar transport system permease protein
MQTKLRRDGWVAYLLLLPAIAGLILYTLLPMAGAFALSLTQWDILTPPVFIGLDNYVEIFTADNFFFASVAATLYFALGSVITGLLYSFVVALMLNQRVPGRGFFRAVFFLPYVVPIIGTTIIWGWMYQANFGVFNYVLSLVGLDKINFLGEDLTATPSLIVMTVWGLGNMIVIFLAGLQSVPATYLEAVAIDGGNFWHKFRHVTLPMMSPIIFFNFLMSVIANLQAFGPAFVLTQGGPNNTTLSMVYLIWREGFQRNNMGHASALSFVLFLFIAALTALIFALSKDKVFFEGD